MRDDSPSPSRGNDIIAAEMTELYDHYFTSHEYDQRYPTPNRSTLKFLFEQGAGQARDILDYGCGSGRYALPLLQTTQSRLTCFDISSAAIAELSRFIQDHPAAARVRMVAGQAERLDSLGDYDLVIMLFGVLSHIGDRTARVAALQQLRRLTRPEGRLILSVPSVFRRRPVELLKAHLLRTTGRARHAQTEAGNILFTRHIDRGPRQFFYHLYSVAGLRAELMEAGFRITALAPESLLPEWMVTQSSWLGKVDEGLLPLLPAALGYGIRAVAVPTPSGPTR